MSMQSTQKKTVFICNFLNGLIFNLLALFQSSLCIQCYNVDAVDANEGKYAFTCNTMSV